MKFSDIIVETQKQQLTEKPMGFLKTMGNKVASTFGSGQAQGRLDTGKEANTLRKEFDVYLGKSGQNPTGDLVLQFLTQKGYPTNSAKNFISAANPQATPAQAKPAAADNPADAQAKPAATPAATTPAQPTKDEIAARVKANVGKTAAGTKASGFGQQSEPAKPNAGAGAFGQMAQQLSKPKEEPATTTPAATTTPPVRAQGGGRVAGQLSQTPGAIRKRQARAVKRRTGHPADDNPNIQLGTESIERYQQMLESRVNFYLLLEEVLSSKQLDQIFLAAVQDKVKGGGSSTAAGAATAQGGNQPAASQSDQPGAQLQQEPGAAKSAGSGSSFMKHAAAAYDGMRGASYGATKIGGDSAGLALKDTSGRIPANIMGQLNQLTDKQRAQLRKELDKA
jgi:hypothetical protein